MAHYRYDWAVKKSVSDAFDQEHRPDTPALYAGVYRCKGCGREIAIAEGHKLPPQNHHQHPPSDGPILWRLTVYADHRVAGQQD